MGEFEWRNSRRRMGYGSAPAPPMNLMDALDRHGRSENSLEARQAPMSGGMSLYSRGQHSGVFEAQNSEPNLSAAGLNGSVPSSAAMEYAATMEDIIRQRVAQQIGQVTQARLQSGPFDQRGGGLAGPREPPPSQLTNLARTVPGLPGYRDSMAGMSQQHGRRLLPGYYDNGIGLMELVGAQPGMMQEEEILRGLREPQQRSSMPLSALVAREREGAAFQGRSTIMNPTSHSRLSCRYCGRWTFSNHIELLEHENSCSASFNSFEGGAMVPRERPPTSDAFSVDQSLAQAISHDRVSGMMRPPRSMSDVEEIVRKLTSGSSSLPARPAASTLRESKDASSFHISKGIPLAMPTDKDWITPLHCFVRLHCVELFQASPSDIFHRSSKGKRRPIHVGRIGIRCPYCHKAEGNASSGASSRVGLQKGSVYFPTTIASIYNATMNLLQRHMHVCENVPDEVMKRYNDLKADDARSGTSKKYWIESATALGLVDTTDGIQFSSVPSAQKTSESAEMFTTENGHSPHLVSPESNLIMMQKASVSSPSMVGGDNNFFSDIEGGPLVAPEYKYLATAYSYALLSQMQACVFTEADRLGKRKGLPLGFAGLACRHCYGGYGSGRFFPSNIKTMSDTSKTLNVLHSHMMRCRKCPSRVKVGLQSLRLGHDEERSKMKFGSQKAFFVNIWKRLHGEKPLDGRKVAQPKKSMVEALKEDDKKDPEVASDKA